MIALHWSPPVSASKTWGHYNTPVQARWGQERRSGKEGREAVQALCLFFYLHFFSLIYPPNYCFICLSLLFFCNIPYPSLIYCTLGLLYASCHSLLFLLPALPPLNALLLLPSSSLHSAHLPSSLSLPHSLYPLIPALPSSAASSTCWRYCQHISREECLTPSLHSR